MRRVIFDDGHETIIHGGEGYRHDRDGVITTARTAQTLQSRANSTVSVYALLHVDADELDRKAARK